MDVLSLRSQGLPHQEIRRLRHISKNILTVYLRQYQSDSVEGLNQVNYKGQSSKLTPHAETLKAHLEKHPSHTVAEASAEIK